MNTLRIVWLLLLLLLASCQADNPDRLQSATSSADNSLGAIAIGDEVYQVEHLSLDRGIQVDSEQVNLAAVFHQGDYQLFLPFADGKPKGGLVLFFGEELFISERIAVEEFEQGETLSISAKLDGSSQESYAFSATLNLRELAD